MITPEGNPDVSTDVLIKGGRVLDPSRDFDETADVLIVSGRVVEIGRISPGEAPPDARVIDAEDCLVTPGLIDCHVHFREPGQEHKETIATGSAAAVAGGFTTVCCMPNTEPALDSVVVLGSVGAKAATARSRVFPVAAATIGRKGEQVAPLAALAEAGAVAFSDDGDVIADAGIMRQVLLAAAATDRCVMQHCQDPTLTRGAVMNAGPLATRLGLTGWPKIAEEIIIDRDVRLNRDIGCRYHAQHVSSGDSVEIIRRARAAGQPISGEASPHHLLLTDDACAGFDTNAKMNPPLRSQWDVDALKEGVADGTITLLATDHAPHTQAEKDRDFAAAPFGIVGLESALGLYAKALIQDGVIDWPHLIAMMTINHARLCGLDSWGLGSLQPGGPGDVTVIDPSLEWTIRTAEFASKSRNCPFEGWAVTGRAIATIVAGEVRHLGARERVGV